MQCGTTEEFCGTSCQSNCVLNPSPPAGGSGKPILNKVIGYYESWNARSSCHKAVPSDLPLDALTHVNFAFAYIDPATYQVTTMDTVTPADLFQSVTDLKSTKADLQVYVSIGGWSVSPRVYYELREILIDCRTFSDNGTATQPLYGEIAADPAKSQSFANNVVRFMTQYGECCLSLSWASMDRSPILVERIPAQKGKNLCIIHHDALRSLVSLESCALERWTHLRI